MKRPCERHGCANAARRWDPYCGAPECDALRAAMVSRARSSRAVRTEREVEVIPSRDEQVSQAASVTPEQPAQPTPAVPDCGPRLVRSRLVSLSAVSDEELVDLLKRVLVELHKRPAAKGQALAVLADPNKEAA